MSSLPPNWTAYTDPATRRVYYSNTKTGAAQWEMPTNEANTDVVAKNRDGYPTVFLHPPSGPGEGSVPVSNGTHLTVLQDIGDSFRVRYEGKDWHVKRHHTVQPSVPVSAPLSEEQTLTRRSSTGPTDAPWKATEEVLEKAKTYMLRIKALDQFFQQPLIQVQYVCCNA